MCEVKKEPTPYVSKATLSFPWKNDTSDPHEREVHHAVAPDRRVTVTIDAIPVSVEIKAEQDVRTSNQKTGQSFTMQDGLNIIRKFGAVGWCKNVCGGAADSRRGCLCG